MTPQESTAIKGAVLIAKKIMYDKATFQQFQDGMLAEQPLPDKLATQAAGLVKIVQEKTNGRLPRSVLVPVAQFIVLEIGKFMEDLGLAKPIAKDIQDAYIKLFQIMKAEFPKMSSRTAPPAPGATQSPAQQSQPPQQPAPQQPTALGPGLVNSQPVGA